MSTLFLQFLQNIVTKQRGSPGTAAGQAHLLHFHGWKSNMPAHSYTMKPPCYSKIMQIHGFKAP